MSKNKLPDDLKKRILVADAASHGLEILDLKTAQTFYGTQRENFHYVYRKEDRVHLKYVGRLRLGDQNEES